MRYVLWLFYAWHRGKEEEQRKPLPLGLICSSFTLGHQPQELRLVIGSVEKRHWYFKHSGTSNLRIGNAMAMFKKHGHDQVHQPIKASHVHKRSQTYEHKTLHVNRAFLILHRIEHLIVLWFSKTKLLRPIRKIPRKCVAWRDSKIVFWIPPFMSSIESAGLTRL